MATRAKRRERRIAGISRDALALGVSRQHLQQVLTGQRQSALLMTRYRQMKTQPAKETNQ